MTGAEIERDGIGFAVGESYRLARSCHQCRLDGRWTPGRVGLQQQRGDAGNMRRRHRCTRQVGVILAGRRIDSVRRKAGDNIDARRRDVRFQDIEYRSLSA